jgi:hypothetical protein
MPLTGKEKKDYQREYTKEYMRRRRLEKPGLNKPIKSFEAEKTGAGRGSRTHKVVTPEDFKSSASANSAIPAKNVLPPVPVF